MFVLLLAGSKVSAGPLTKSCAGVLGTLGIAAVVGSFQAAASSAALGHAPSDAAFPLAVAGLSGIAAGALLVSAQTRSSRQASGIARNPPLAGSSGTNASNLGSATPVPPSGAAYIYFVPAHIEVFVAGKKAVVGHVRNSDGTWAEVRWVASTNEAEREAAEVILFDRNRRSRLKYIRPFELPKRLERSEHYAYDTIWWDTESMD